MANKKPLESLISALEQSDSKIVFGLQPYQIKLIEASIAKFNGLNNHELDRIAKEISWCPKTLTCYYINYLLEK